MLASLWLNLRVLSGDTIVAGHGRTGKGKTMQAQTEPEQIASLNEDNVEGLGEGDQSEYMDYPIDTVHIRTETRTVYDVLRRIDKKDIILHPEFQRDFIWNDSKQSKLIESVIMRIPLPVFYFAEDKQGRLVVVDGLQRISTFKRFVSNNLKLVLPRSSLNGLRFQDLPNKLQNRIEDCNLTLYSISSEVPERARLDMFERVNGGEPLSRQQMRNCLFMGKGTRFLSEESRTSIFLKAIGGNLDTKKMRDREFVNRFCAFQLLEIDDYKDMDEFLASALEVMNRKDTLQDLSFQFKMTLSNNFYIFGKHAFRKYAPDQEKRSLLNASLWDVMSTGLSRYPTHLVLQYSQNFKEAYYALLRDDLFNDSITSGTSSVKKVRHRFFATEQMLKEVFGDYKN